jgi:uncharacterized OB-fold protein
MSQFPEQVYRHHTSSATKGWRERFGRYRLAGTKCKKCGEVHFPRRTVCPYCHNRDLEYYENPTTGKIEWCEVSYSPAGIHFGYGENIPRTPAVIQLDNGIKVLGEICDSEDNEIIPGARVEMTIKKIRRESNSSWQYGYKFKVVG